MDRGTDKRSNNHECEINHISGYGYIMDGEPVQTHDGYVVHLKRSTSASMFGGIREFYYKIRTLNFQNSYLCEVFGKYCLIPWSQVFSFYRFCVVFNRDLRETVPSENMVQSVHFIVYTVLHGINYITFRDQKNF